MFFLAYPAQFRRDNEGRWIVRFPDLLGALTDGADLKEAMDEGVDCLGSWIGFLMTDKVDIPKPSILKRGQKLVPVPFWIAGKLALYWAVREMGISQTDLARKLGVRETVVRRLLDPNHDSRPEKVQAAVEAIGRRVVLAYCDAA